MVCHLVRMISLSDYEALALRDSRLSLVVSRHNYTGMSGPLDRCLPLLQGESQ